MGSGHGKTYISELNQQFNNFNGELIHIKGTLILDGPTTFKNCTIKVDGGAKIIIEQPSIKIPLGLNLTNTHISSCDHERWYGIECEPGRSVIMLNSSIRHADKALLLYGSNIIAIDNSEFIDNYIGIYSPGFPGSIQVRYIIRSTFKTQNGLRLPFDEDMGITDDNRGYAGIYIINSPYFPIGVIGGTDNYLEEDNIFENLHAGVVGIRTSMLIRNTQFKDILHVQPHETSSNKLLDNAISMDGKGGIFILDQQGKGALNLNFNNCQRSFYVQNMTDVSIRFNSMTSAKAGILLTDGVNAGNHEVSGNTIHVHSNGIYSLANAELSSIKISNNLLFQENYLASLGASSMIQSFGGPSQGVEISSNQITLDPALEWDVTQAIHLESTPGAIIHSNEMTAISASPSNTSLHYLLTSFSPDLKVTENIIEGYPVNGWQESGVLGILSHFCPGSEFYCNSLDQVGAGLIISGNNDASKISNNYFHDLGFGLWYLGLSSNGPRQKNAANRWEGTNYHYAAYSGISDPMISNESGFDAHTDDMAWFPDPLHEEVAGWFYTDPGLSEPTGICPDPAGLTNPEADDYYTAITQDYPEMPFMDGQAYWAQWHLYGALLRDSSLTNDPDVWQWHADQMNDVKGIAHHFYSQIHNPLADATDLRIALDATIIATKQQMESFHDYAEAYENTPDSLWLPIDSLVAIVLDSLDSLDEHGRWLWTIRDSLLQAYKTHAVSVLDGLSLNYIQDSNLIRALKLYYGTIFIRMDTLTSNQKYQLSQIAGQCIFQGGPGVALARIILMMTQPEASWDDAQWCYPAEPLVSSAEFLPNMDNELLVSPNPASSDLRITSMTGNILRVKLLVVSGRLMLDLPGPYSDFQQVSVASLPKGLYLIQVHTENKILIRKLIVK